MRYRVFLLDGQHVIRSVDVVVCPDDRAAVAKARDLLTQRPQFHGFQLWQRSRRVHVEVPDARVAVS
jgi:hypothetical protein